MNGPEDTFIVLSGSDEVVSQVGINSEGKERLAEVSDVYTFLKGNYWSDAVNI